MLKAIYLGGNPFVCHCGLSWINTSVTSSLNNRGDLSDSQESPESIRVVDINQIFCRTDVNEGKRANSNNNIVLLSDISHKFANECEPYIIPLFESSNVEKMMGKNISWPCKALGSEDIDLLWRLPRRMPSQHYYKVTMKNKLCYCELHVFKNSI